MSAAPVAIQYWLSTSSPGTWLGSGRFVDPRRPAPTRWPCFHAVLHALSAQVRGIADWELLAALARDRGLDGPALVESARAPATGERYLENTRRAIAAEVFGSPTWVVAGERFWGQDRPDLLAERILGA